jgi:hypothetical protein
MTTQPRRTPNLTVASEPEVFDARAQADTAETAYPPFVFIGMDGETYQLPHVLMLKAGEQAAIIEAQASGKAEQAEVAMRTLLSQVAPDALAAMDQMPNIVAGRLMLAWQTQASEGVQALGEELGERSAPNRAAKRSKRTSPSVGSTSGT